MAVIVVVERRRLQAAARAVVIEHLQLRFDEHDAFAEAPRDIERCVEDEAAFVIDETGGRAEMRGGESFIKLVGELELHRDDERARSVDVAPTTGILDETDDGDALLPDVDGRETFREVAAEIKRRMRDQMAPRVYVLARSEEH